MSDENLDQVNEQEIADAKAMGWAEQSEWRGRAEDWVDAKTFLERGRTVMPILQRNNERLLAEHRARDAQIVQLQNELKAQAASLEALEKSAAADAAAQVEAARAELRLELEEALRDGDHKAAAKITEDIANLKVEEKPTEEKSATKDGGADPSQLPPEIIAWYGRNKEFAASPRHVALAQGVMQELLAGGETLRGAALLDKVADEVEKILTPVRQHGRVGSGNGGGGRSGGGGGGGGGKGYSDLPADAKAACDRMAPRLVGPNRAHKDEASWRASYAREYFKRESA